MADKAPKSLTIADFQSAAKERPEQFIEGLNTLNRVNNGISAAQRAAINAAQSADHPSQVLEAAKQGFINPEQAAKWEDIAKKAGVENKYGLAAAGIMGPLAEVDLIPGPNLGAAVKEEKGLATALQKLAKPDNIGAEARAIKGTEKVIQPILNVAETDTGKLLNAAKAEQELRAVQTMSKQAPLQVVPNLSSRFMDDQVKNKAKQFALKAVKEELDAQPALKRDPDYLKQRLQELASFFFKQNR